jgi:hypothetical protein
LVARAPELSSRREPPQIGFVGFGSLEPIEAPIEMRFQLIDRHAPARTADHSIVMVRGRCRKVQVVNREEFRPLRRFTADDRRGFCRRLLRTEYAEFGYGAGAGVVAFHRSTTDAVVVLSDFLNPATGAFEKRNKYPNFSAR